MDTEYGSKRIQDSFTILRIPQKAINVDSFDRVRRRRRNLRNRLPIGMFQHYNSSCYLAALEKQDRHTVRHSTKPAVLRHLDYKGKTGLEEICSEAAIAKRLNPQDPKCSYGEILPSQTF